MKNSTFLGGFLVALCLICMAGTIYPGGGGGGTLKGIITTGAASGTTNNSVVTIDVSGTGGDVLAAGNTTFTGNNIFGGTATSNTFTHVVSFGSPVTFSNRVDITGALTTPTINGNVVHGGASNTFTGVLSVGGDLSVTGGVYTAGVTANTANFGSPAVLSSGAYYMLTTNGAGDVVVSSTLIGTWDLAGAIRAWDGSLVATNALFRTNDPAGFALRTIGPVQVGDDTRGITAVDSSGNYTMMTSTGFVYQIFGQTLISLVTQPAGLQVEGGDLSVGFGGQFAGNLSGGTNTAGYAPMFKNEAYFTNIAAVRYTTNAPLSYNGADVTVDLAVASYVTIATNNDFLLHLANPGLSGGRPCLIEVTNTAGSGSHRISFIGFCLMTNGAPTTVFDFTNLNAKAQMAQFSIWTRPNWTNGTAAHYYNE